MPPKFNPDDPETAELIMLFQTIGFSKAKATETAKNAKNASALKELEAAVELFQKAKVHPVCCRALVSSCAAFP